MSMWYHRQDFSAEYTAVLKDAILNQYGISEDELNSLPEPEQYMKIQTGTRDLFLATLEHQGFDYDIMDENGDFDIDGTSGEEGYIDFSFQNNDFCARAYNNWDYVTIWKYGRGSIDFKDDEELAKIMDLANRLNDRIPATLMCDVYEFSERRVSISTKITFPFIPTIPNLDFYLHRQLRFLFEAEKRFRFELEKMNSAEQREREEGIKEIRIARLEKIKKKLTNMKSKEEKEPGSRDLFLKTLKRLKCEYEIDSYDDICFEFCGEEFSVTASNSMKFITIYDYAWWGVSLDDIDEVARMRRVVNDTNWEGRVNVVFTVNEEAHQIVVHSKMTILYVSSITGLSSYLKDVLNDFFRAKFLFENALEKQRKGNL